MLESKYTPPISMFISIVKEKKSILRYFHRARYSNFIIPGITTPKKNTSIEAKRKYPITKNNINIYTPYDFLHIHSFDER